MSFTTYLVDDDPGVLRALSRIIRSAGYESRSFSSPHEFLNALDRSAPACAIFDLMMPDLNGLQLQQRLADTGCELPIIFLSGRGDIPASVHAMKAGAIDFLVKPVKRENLLPAIARAEERDAAIRQERVGRETIKAKLEKLTPREFEVLEHVIMGQLNKQIAAALGTVEKTVKVHRGRMMAKLGVRSVAELVRLAERVQIGPQL